MQQEQTIVNIHITDSSTSLTVGAHIRQFIVLTKGLSIAGGTNAASNIEFLLYDIPPDIVNGLNIALITGQGSPSAIPAYI